jgi:UDP-N-acetylmuramoylalanine--D-glutamate ligase
MGLGLNGGGLASARFFASCGARVTITDKKTAQELAPSIEALKEYPDIRYVLGTHELDDFTNADIVIKNPGVKLTGNPYLAASKRIESDISIFLALTKAPILAVTGSKGKSSTVSALQWGLRALGYNSFLGGNITVSPLTFLDETDENTPVVLELSSWQLADLRDRKLLKPRVAILTPVMADHQNWYGNMESYVADKKLIYADMDGSSHLICNADDEWGPVFASEVRTQGERGAQGERANIHWYSAHELDGRDLEPTDGAWLAADGRGFMRQGNSDPFEILPAALAVPGQHMRANLLNAAQALVLFGAEPKAVGPALANFPGIEHRLELFHEKHGVRWYNDSAATIPEATCAAITSFEKPVILIAGGTDKNLDFTPLAETASRAKKIFLLAGTGTDKLMPMLAARGVAFSGPYPNLDAIVNAARDAAEKGDIVVFSPGATSFGLFTNEFDRGNKFRIAVTNIAN